MAGRAGTGQCALFLAGGWALLQDEIKIFPIMDVSFTEQDTKDSKKFSFITNDASFGLLYCHGFVIDGGAATTTTTSVTLTLSGIDAHTGVGRMRIGNDGMPWSPWEPYATTKPWTLTAGPGIKRVWVQYENNALMTGSAYSDTIELPEPGFALSIASGFLWLGCLSRLRRRRSNGSR